MQMFVLIFAQSVAAPAAAVGNGTTLYSIWSQPTTRKTPPSSFPSRQPLAQRLLLVFLHYISCE